jgi:hypothetical protein
MSTGQRRRGARSWAYPGSPAETLWIRDANLAEQFLFSTGTIAWEL